MKINKLALALIAFSSMSLVGCNKQNENTNTSSPNSGTNLKGQAQKSLNGRWIWQAKKDGKVLGMGEFDLKENNGDLTGATKALIPSIEPIKGRAGNENATAAIIVMPLKGRRDGNSLKFEVKDASGLITKNEANLTGLGKMQGKSYQEAKAQDVDAMGLKSNQMKKSSNGSTVMEYNWIAVQVSNK
jgi:hypothetical protein